MDSATKVPGVRGPLDELLGMASAGLRTVTSDPLVALSHAWFVRCVDNVRAALVLDDQNLGTVADPLVRSAIEHAVGMIWLQQLGGAAVSAVGRSHQRWAANLRRAVAAANANETDPGREDWSPALNLVFEELAAQELPEGSVDGEWKIDERFQVAKAFDLTWPGSARRDQATRPRQAPRPT
jgi:hypothetical protein